MLKKNINSEVLGVYQNYPNVLENNTFNDMDLNQESFDNTSTTPSPPSTPSTTVITNKIVNPSSAGFIVGIIFAIIISFIIIVLNYKLFMSFGMESIYNPEGTISIGDWELDLNIIYHNILLIIMVLLLIFMIVIFAKSLALSKNTQNMFNCEVKSETYIPGHLVSELGINENILKKLDIQPTNPICSLTNNKLRDIVFNEERNKFVGVSILFPSILIIGLILIRIYKNNVFDFLINGWNGMFKYLIFLFFSFALIALNIAVGNHIISNKLAFKGDVSTFQKKIDNISGTANNLTNDELNEVNTKLSNSKFDINTLIIAQEPNTNFTLNTQTSSYDGLVIFTHTTIVILFICISLICLIGNPFGSFANLFNLSSDLILKVIFMILIFIPFVGLSIASIMYPSMISNNALDSIILTSSVSPSVATIIAIILSIFITSKGGFM
jgi:hypothetical protein